MTNIRALYFGMGLAVGLMPLIAKYGLQPTAHEHVERSEPATVNYRPVQRHEWDNTTAELKRLRDDHVRELREEKHQRDLTEIRLRGEIDLLRQQLERVKRQK